MAEHFEFMKFQLGIHWHCSSCEKSALKAAKNDQEIETRCNALFEDFVSRIYSMECKVAALKQEIIHSVKNEIRGVSAHAIRRKKTECNFI